MMQNQTEMTQMNVRIPLALKRDGDSIIARFGKSPSDIVRLVWSYIVLHGKLPEGLAEKDTPIKIIDENNQTKLLNTLAEETGLSVDCLKMGNREDAYELMYEQMLKEYEALDA